MNSVKYLVRNLGRDSIWGSVWGSLEESAFYLVRDSLWGSPDALIDCSIKDSLESEIEDSFNKQENTSIAV